MRKRSLKSLTMLCNGFAQLLDLLQFRVPKEASSLFNVLDRVRQQTHETCDCRVSSYGVVGQHKRAQVAGASMQRPFPFHRQDAICNDEVNRHGGTDI